ncbi:glycoside hydrolase family 3 protein [Prolixibacteraceae bacterium JC049]|nr:glycoside hydrolase family 3 protein [Prolixibacteraceae bacterium JC049]
MRVSFLAVVLFLAIQGVFAQQNTKAKYLDVSLDFETRTTDLVEQMTLDEKISQLGSSAPAIPRLGIQQYDWWNECLHGVARAGIATVFPQAIGMAATFDTAMMKKVADVIADEARAKYHEAQRNKEYGRYFGLTFWSPNINIFRDPRWGRGHETYGEDPYLAGQMGVQFVKGLQGNHPKYMKLVATAKHFAVHNGPEPDRHTFNAVPNVRDLWETYLPAFEDLIIDGKAYSVMGAYNRVDGESATASWMLLEDILRRRWGFDGYVVSDCGAVRDIYANHKIVNTSQEAAAVGIRRGCDLNCGGVYQSALKKAVEQGLIDEQEIDVAVHRLMLARMKLGMFDPDEMVPFASTPFEVNDSKANNEMALEMAQKTMTLLKNDGILPLNKKKIRRIAVVGPNANSVPALYANYSGVASHPITVIDGIRKAVGKKAKVTFSEGVPLVIDENKLKDFKVIESKFLSTTNEKGKKVAGLKGEYFANKKLEGKSKLSRIDEEVNFKWSGSPTDTEVAQGILSKAEGLPRDNFSVRWSGKLLAPRTGKYKLGLVSDDGCRIYLNGEKIADDWTDHAPAAILADVELQKGKTYDIKVEFYESTGGAQSMLVWKVPGEEKKVEETILTKETLANVKKADVAVFVGGLDATWEGEEMGGRVNIDGFYKGDRTKIELPAKQIEAIKAMKATGTPVVLVLMAGSAISFDGLEKELDAIVLAWYPGQRGGDAVADVLFGDYNPAGRLPVTYYNSTDDLADFSDYNMRAGKGFTYRYHKGDVLYPFGHGLSYTNFEYSAIKTSQKEVCDEGNVTVSVTVKNSGQYDGEEVVQLYIRDIKSDKWMPIKQLRRFERIALKKGESKTLEFKLDIAKDFRYYDPVYQRYMVEPGQFEIQVGTSSQDIRLKETLTVE